MQKTARKKRQIFEKWDDFENRPSCQGYSPCKGYSLCKIVSLGQKLKMPKTCENSFYKSIKVVLCKKPLEKTQIFGNETILKIVHLPKAIAHAKAIYSLCKIVSLCQKLKMPTRCKNSFYKSIKVVLCKKPLEKTPNIRKWDDFENRSSCKGYSPCKGYSLCKIVSLGQKLKMPKTCQNSFYESIRVVLCKKPLEKTPNIREMRRFWKSAILQRL